ncbi:MAG: peptide deformylase [Gammaproteobacteria bacterium]|nr:peptide deformylase [Gammaproteobacteria bacterium]
MAVLEIIHYPDDRLKQASDTVTLFDQSLKDFLVDLEETRLSGPGAVGIAAPQVGVAKRIAIVDLTELKKPVDNHGHLLMINPEITQWQGMEKGREGCLSVPDFTGNVIRAEKITIRFQNSEAQWAEFETRGYEARAIQHEIDHLDGMLFLDRLVSRRADLFQRKVYKK